MLIPPQNTGPSTGAAFAHFSHANPTRDLGQLAAGQRTVVWAGWLDDPDVGPPGDPATGRFPANFRTWSKPGWDALITTLTGIADQLVERESSLCLRPSAGCVLADPQSCLTFLREHRPALCASRVEILLDPIAMLTPSMMDHLEDHLARTFDCLADHDSVVGLVRAAPVVDGDRVVHGVLAENPEMAELIDSFVQNSPLVSKPVLATDPRDLNA